METPYVISEDVRLALEPWARQNKLMLPPDRFFTDLRDAMRLAFSVITPEIMVVQEEELQEGLRELCQGKDSSSLVSLERLYMPELTQRIESNRTVQWVRQGWRDADLASRTKDTLAKQIQRLARTLPDKITLVDDVIFSGESALELIEMFRAVNKDVCRVIAGIAIGEGKDRLESEGVEVQQVRYFPEVVDEVCQRDFFPGVPGSGRAVKGRDNVGVPYIYPYGDPIRWASIPPIWAGKVSQACLELTAELRLAIEETNSLLPGSLLLPRGVAYTPSKSKILV